MLTYFKHIYDNDYSNDYSNDNEYISTKKYKQSKQSKQSNTNIKNILIFFENKLKYISNDNHFNGFIVFIIHYLFLSILYYLLLFFPISLYYYAIVSFWIISIVLSNIYFKGCLFTKLERHLWNTKEWIGPHFLFYNSSSLSSTMIQNLFICKVIFIATIIYMRILFYY